ncbi:CoA-transferase [Streptomyces sp. NPDC003362]
MSTTIAATTDEAVAGVEDGATVASGSRPGSPSTCSPDAGTVLHTENGMLGMGPAAAGDEVDPDLTNAGKVPVTELPGAAYFHHADSFAMMRGGHLDVCVLGAFQVSHHGDLAIWHTGEPDARARRVQVMMKLFARDGAPQAGARVHVPP